jgi:murein DD-endopeptidase MepM/ murein hydrolase activator NlpD
VVFAALDWSGYGNLVEVAHGGGVISMYAHLSSFSVRVGQFVSTGTRVGRVGSTGEATGPHLHFEVRVRGAAVDPVPAFG